MLESLISLLKYQKYIYIYIYIYVVRKDTPEEQLASLLSVFSNFLVRCLTGGGSLFNKIPIEGNMFRDVSSHHQAK